MPLYTSQNKLLARMQSDRKFYSLLVGIQNEDSLVVSCKVKHSLPI